MIYLAIDPGGCTGWAAWRSEDDAFWSDENEGMYVFRRQFDSFIETSNPWEIRFVIEDFTISARTVTTSLDYSALRIIGYVDLMCERLDYLLDWQRPAQIKSKSTVGTDINLKKLGWYKAGMGGHANDAARHLLVFLRNNADFKHQMRKLV